MSMTLISGVAARMDATGAAVMGITVPAYAGFAVAAELSARKPRVQGTDVPNGGMGANHAWSPPD